MGTFRHFSDIRAWQEARILAREVYALLAASPAVDHGLRDQLRRSAVSILANIAEGFARGTDPQFLRHLDIARGSAAELEALIILAADLEAVPPAGAAKIRERLDLVQSLIAKLTSYLRGGRTGEEELQYGTDQDSSSFPSPSFPRTSGLPDFRTSGLLP